MPRFKRLMDERLTMHVGVSNHDLAQWQACEAALGGPVLSNQVRFSLVHREPERELVPWAQRNGRIVIAYVISTVVASKTDARSTSEGRRT